MEKIKNKTGFRTESREEVEICNVCEEESENECDNCGSPICMEGCNGELGLTSSTLDDCDTFLCGDCAKPIREKIKKLYSELI